MIASSGKTVWVHDIVKCEHQEGKPAELRGFMLDISERKRAEEALRESEERMSLAANTTGLGLWVWDASRDESWVTPEGRRLFGWAESEPVNLERFIRTLHPDDREPTREAVLRSLQNGGDLCRRISCRVERRRDPLDCDARADRVGRERQAASDARRFH